LSIFVQEKEIENLMRKDRTFKNNIGLLNYVLLKNIMLFLLLGYLQTGYSQKSKIFYVPDSFKKQNVRRTFQKIELKFK